MEAEIGADAHRFYDLEAVEMNGVGRRGMEWDLNDWRWDGDLFVATPLNNVPSDCRSKQLFPVAAIGGLSNSSSSCSGETDPGIKGKGKGESEKRRREVVVLDNDEPDDEANSLTLKLGGHVYSVSEQVDLANCDVNNGKRSKVQAGNSNRAMCQVEGCGADLSQAKDYHRRHKVCETHAKASKALVGNVMQRFCQQCSRFHLLQEFDEGKRSCRRRLAGHNRRRRKTHPDAVANGTSFTDDNASSYLLISLLRILTNLHSDGSGQLKDQDLLSHLLKNLAILAGSFDARNLHGILQTSQDLQRVGTGAATSSEAARAIGSNGALAQESSVPVRSGAKTNCITECQGSPMRPTNQPVSVALGSVEMPQQRNLTETTIGENLQAVLYGRPASLMPAQGCTSDKAGVSSLKQVLPRCSTVERVRYRSFDLNDVCSDGHDVTEEPEDLVTSARLQTGPIHCPPWVLQDSNQASPPQTSGNSDSASAQSLSSSNGDAQCRTDRMVFKLFGKDPSDLPLVLRAQILDWLSNSPTDIEGYIRPGCIILTIYLRLAESTWEQICHNIRSILERLLDVTGDEFWRRGWVYARIQHQIAFIYNGQVVLDTPLLISSHSCQILSVTPIAVCASKRVNFTVRGLNLAQSSIRLLCAFEGKYLVEETTQDLVDSTSTSNEQDGVQYLSFSCSMPNGTGRGFIEVEDHSLCSTFFPFIVAEDDVSSEICMLESTINSTSFDGNCHDLAAGMKLRSQALDFLHEMGWLLRRSHLQSSSENLNSHASAFPLTRFRWLMEFSMANNWCAVVKKLLDVLFGGAVDVGGHPVEIVLAEMALLHNAVQKNLRSMVEFLLRYVPADDLECSVSQNIQEKSGQKGFLFRPDMLGPFDVTPLHIAASRDGAEGMLDVLTNDPGQVGIKAWKSARDSSGITPEDYAVSRGYKSYVHLVQKKINEKSGMDHVIEIPGISAGLDANKKQASGPNSSRSNGFQIEKRVRPTLQASCKICTQRQLAFGIGNGNLTYRPAMCFMVGIAAVCVCVGILLHSPPEVFSVFPPFRWELLDYGFM
uniref:Squamosa promoter-binding-like protein 12 n=1 Tax=Anthurium amnicola TaxID=1678845 RepID=A0A1D1XPS6_9ARAE